jgi:hypothetical protein
VREDKSKVMEVQPPHQTRSTRESYDSFDSEYQLVSTDGLLSVGESPLINKSCVYIFNFITSLENLSKKSCLFINRNI